MRTWALLTLLFTFLPAGVSAQSAEDEAPAYESVDWTEAIAAKIPPKVCAAPIDVRPASLVGDELRAVEFLRRTLVRSGRQVALGSESPDCVLRVHTPSELDGWLRWRIDVSGTVDESGSTEGSTTSVVLQRGTNNNASGGQATAAAEADRREEFWRRKRRQRSTTRAVVGVGVVVVGGALLVGLGYLLLTNFPVGLAY